MSGSDNNKGIIPRSFSYLFESLKASSTRKKESSYHVYVSFIQIYLETIQDLLNPEAKDIRIREDPESGVFLEGVEWIKVETPNDCESIYQYGQKNRVTQSTKMNMFSSRSHAIFIITVEQMTSLDDGSTITKIGKLNLVDLAGSERIRVTGAKGKQLEESKRINKSLSALGNVINALTDPKGSNHIPYRDSKLTMLLRNSLTPSSKNIVIVNISAEMKDVSQTKESLSFATNALFAL